MTKIPGRWITAALIAALFMTSCNADQEQKDHNVQDAQNRFDERKAEQDACMVEEFENALYSINFYLASNDPRDWQAAADTAASVESSARLKCTAQFP